jgi:hypothetical protein
VCSGDRDAPGTNARDRPKIQPRRLLSRRSGAAYTFVAGPAATAGLLCLSWPAAQSGEKPGCRSSRRTTWPRVRGCGSEQSPRTAPHAALREFGVSGLSRGWCCPAAAADGGAGDVEIVTASRRRRSRSEALLWGRSALAATCVAANDGLDQVGATGGGDHVSGLRAIRAKEARRRHRRDAAAAQKPVELVARPSARASCHRCCLPPTNSAGCRAGTRSQLLTSGPARARESPRRPPQSASPMAAFRQRR